MRIAEGEREKVANQFSVVGSRWAYSPKPMMGIIERQRSSDRQASKSSGGAEVFFFDYYFFVFISCRLAFLFRMDNKIHSILLCATRTMEKEEDCV